MWITSLGWAFAAGAAAGVGLTGGGDGGGGGGGVGGAGGGGGLLSWKKSGISCRCCEEEASRLVLPPPVGAVTPPSVRATELWQILSSTTRLWSQAPFLAVPTQSTPVRRRRACGTCPAGENERP